MNIHLKKVGLRVTFLSRALYVLYVNVTQFKRISTQGDSGDVMNSHVSKTKSFPRTLVRGFPVRVDTRQRCKYEFSKSVLVRLRLKVNFEKE